MHTFSRPQQSSTDVSTKAGPALVPDEARRVAQWEPGPVRTRPAWRFHELFESVADTHPGRPAVVTEAGVETYVQVEHQANRIARILLDHGVTSEEPVAVLTECSPHLPATVLGIWKAGAAYLPLALEQPPERLAFMTKDAGARLLIVLDENPVPPALEAAVDTILRPDLCEQDSEQKASLSQNVRPKIASTPHDLAYIIYTSGTSGMPKGVLIQHDALVNVAYMSEETFALTPEDRVSLVATPGFDASLWESRFMERLWSHRELYFCLRGTDLSAARNRPPARGGTALGKYPHFYPPRKRRPGGARRNGGSLAGRDGAGARLFE